MASKRSRSSSRNKRVPSPAAPTELKEIKTPSTPIIGANSLGFTQDVAYCVSNIGLGLLWLYALRRFKFKDIGDDFLEIGDKNSVFIYSVVLLGVFSSWLIYGKERINQFCLHLAYLHSCSCWMFMTFLNFGILDLELYRHGSSLAKINDMDKSGGNPYFEDNFFVGIFGIVMIGLTFQYLYLGWDSDKFYAPYSVVNVLVGIWMVLFETLRNFQNHGIKVIFTLLMSSFGGLCLAIGPGAFLLYGKEKVNRGILNLSYCTCALLSMFMFSLACSSIDPTIKMGDFVLINAMSIALLAATMAILSLMYLYTSVVTPTSKVK